MIKRNKIIFGVVSFGIIFLVIFIYIKKMNKSDTYRESTIKKDSIQLTILSTGTVQPDNRLEIKPPVAGRIEKILVAEGDKVRKGQVLAWMSSTERAAMIDSARAQGQSEVEKWEDIYKATPVVAPIEGMIIKKNIESGQTFTTNDAVLVMSNKLTVKAQVDETDLAKIRLKQQCEVVLDSYPEQKMSAQVDQIAYEAKTVNNVTTYIIEVLPTNKPPEFMRSGMTANITFFIEKKDNVLVIETEFIKYINGKTFVLIQDEKNHYVEKEIEIGSSEGLLTEVKAGLNLDDKVFLKNLGSDKVKSSSPFSPFGSRPKGGPPR